MEESVYRHLEDKLDRLLTRRIFFMFAFICLVFIRLALMVILEIIALVFISVGIWYFLKKLSPDSGLPPTLSKSLRNNVFLNRIKTFLISYSLKQVLKNSFASFPTNKTI
ncbi:hypothetical protein CDIK_0526 [Cucumispora dikerogammari]|nr:hypothetical protein CDIK_0526 [Cucumispora dikerogammari]